MPYRAFLRRDLDITDPKALARALGSDGAIVNAAAYTAVDRAEQDVEQAMRINASAPGEIAALAEARQIPLIQLSTDYVFDGHQATPYREEDPVNPLSVYGRSKEAGERAVRSICHRHIIIRTAWIFDSKGPNFVRTMLRLAAQRPELAVVDDQKGGPTAADDIAQAILQVLPQLNQTGFKDWGTYHFIGAPQVSWYQFACAILQNQQVRVRPIPAADYPTAATRPANSVLDCRKISQVFGIEQPDWRHSLKNVMKEIAMETVT